MRKLQLNLSTKKNSKSTLLSMLFITIFFFSIYSCKKDDDEPTPNNRGEKENAYLREVYTFSANGGIFYLDVTDDLKSDPDLSNAVELGENVRVLSVGEFPMSISSDAKTITKWKVDKKTLKPSVDAILSYASTGIEMEWYSIDISFVSETSAFINDLAEGIIVEFNPTTMEITKTYNVTPLEYPKNFGIGTKGTVYNGKIIFPIQWIADYGCCNYPYKLNATVAIFDPATGKLTYSVDDRAMGLDRVPHIDENSTAYVTPSYGQNQWMNHFFDTDQEGEDMKILRLNEDGSIDKSFELNLKEGLPDATYFYATSFIYDNKAMITYSETPITGTYDDRYTVRNNTFVSKSVLYDMNTNEVTPYTAFDGYRSVSFLASIDEVNYYRASKISNSGDAYDDIILVQKGVTDFTELSTLKGGQILFLSELW